MLEKMGFTSLERWAIHILTQSKHVGLLVVKEYASQNTYVARDETDPVSLPNFAEEPEPLSMSLERMFHAPSFGERE